MDVIPTIRAPRTERADDPALENVRWRQRYEAYLQSPEWRSTRDAALRRARWKCSRCPSQTTLQAHHKTYARLGCEEPDDLEVLCARCHEGVHIGQAQEVRGIYLAVVSDCLRRERFTCMADLVEAVKALCAQRKIRYDGAKVWRAVALADANREGVIDAPKPRIRPYTVKADGPAFTKLEALDFCRDKGFNVHAWAMPGLIQHHDYATDQERANEIRRQGAQMVAEEAEGRVLERQARIERVRRAIEEAADARERAQKAS